MSINKVFGKVLRRTRRWKDISQESLAFDADISRTYISKLENGVYQPTLGVIFSLAKVLELKPSELLDLVEDEIESEEN